MDRSRTAAVALLALALATAGCIGTEVGTPTVASPGVSPTTPSEMGTSPATPPTEGRVDFPDGPKERPERPAVLNETSVREYVSAFEYRLVYNTLWVNEHTDVTLACRVDDVSERSWGYEAVVTCTGYSDTTVPENATATPGPHADWFTQSFRYRVDENSTRRRQVDSRDPVS